MNNLNSAELAAALNQLARGRHERSAALIYRHYAPQLARYIQVQVWDVDVAREIAHEALRTALESPGRFDGSCAYSTWLIGIVRNLLKAHWRKTDVAQARFAEDADEALSELAASDDDPVDRLERMRERESIQVCMERLPPLYREAIAMQYVGDQSTDEIATVLEVPPGTVKSRLHKARDLLRKCLSRRGIEGARP